MSSHAAFRRQALPQQYVQNLKPHTLPAPTRGIVQHENEAFMQPGGCIVCDNWFPTMRGVKLRGGCIRHCDLHALDAPAWANSTVYSIGNQRYDGSNGTIWQCAVAHTSPATPTTFAQDRAANPTRWTAVTFTRNPVVSMFEYAYGSNLRIFAAQQTKVFDVTVPTPVLVKSGQTNGNYAAAQMSNLSGNYLIAVNDAGQPPLRFDGTTWLTLDAGAPSADQIKNPAGTAPMAGLTYVWKYLSRLFFICLLYTSPSPRDS